MGSRKIGETDFHASPRDSHAVPSAGATATVEPKQEHSHLAGFINASTFIKATPRTVDTYFEMNAS